MPGDKIVGEEERNRWGGGKKQVEEVDTLPSFSEPMEVYKACLLVSDWPGQGHVVVAGCKGGREM